MTERTLTLEPLTAQAFAPFGDVIERRQDKQLPMNADRFQRYNDLAAVDVGDEADAVNVSIIDCVVVSELPYAIEVLERHPKGSQAFIPLGGEAFVVVVAPPGDTPDLAALKAFRVDGRQGINMRRGVWHIPLIGFRKGQTFLIVDYKGGNNCDTHTLDAPVMLHGAL
jgi:ureidoglycolate lyase